MRAISGIGGDRMIEAGADIQFNIVRDLAIIGFIEPIVKFPAIRRLFPRYLPLPP
jgi:lipid A disaccharide synthetase